MHKHVFSNLIGELIKFLNVRNNTAFFTYEDMISSTPSAVNHTVHIKYMNETVYYLYYDLFKDDNSNFIIRQFNEEFEFFKKAIARINFQEMHKEIKRIEERNRINHMYSDFDIDYVNRLSEIVNTSFELPAYALNMLYKHGYVIGKPLTNVDVRNASYIKGDDEIILWKALDGCYYFTAKHNDMPTEIIEMDNLEEYLEEQQENGFNK